jgi:predicted solute-binding protein
MIAPASSISLLKHESIEQALPLGIVARSSVRSVYLASTGVFSDRLTDLAQRLAVLREIFEHCRDTQKHFASDFSKLYWDEVTSLEPLLDGKSSVPIRVRFTEQSETSVALARIFLRSVLFNRATSKQDLNIKCSSACDADAPEIELLIGDEALRRRSQFKHLIDLGSFWSNMTGMSFVFGLWQKRAGTRCPAPLLTKIMTAALDAQVKMKASPMFYMGEKDLAAYQTTISQASLQDYWRLIDYTIDADDLESLKAFFSLTSSMLENWDQNYLAKIAKWQDRLSAQPVLQI